MKYLIRMCSDVAVPKELTENTKVIINRCYGGFCLSDKALSLYEERTGNNIERAFTETYRFDKTLIKIVEELGKEANGNYSYLEVIEFPSYITCDMLEVEEYDGLERVYPDFGQYLYRQLVGNIDIENSSDADIAGMVKDVIKIERQYEKRLDK